MRPSIKTLTAIVLILLSIAIGVWKLRVPDSSAADVNVRLVIPSPTCGNGIDEGVFEECDDGNLVNGDGCDNVCYLEVCGNGVLQINEECDDANLVNGDSCDSLCFDEICGNSRIQFGEECDDGGTVDGDSCDSLCFNEVCGNGRVQINEECDDGGTVDGDGCDSLCYSEVCGNGRVQSGEQCDDGNVDTGDGCNATCQIEVCGDGAVQGAEECDDGNLLNGDSCDSECFNEVCGNSRVQSGEVCDDGNANNGDGCNSTCTVELGYACVGTPSCCSLCGDGAIECNEECDDGKQCVNGVSCISDPECFGIGDNLCTVRSGDSCSATCTSEASGGGPSTPQEIIITKVTAYPEQRSGAAGSNYDSKYHFSVLNPDNLNHSVYYTHQSLQNITNSGIGYPYVTIGGASAGVYDVTFKTSVHLTSMLDNVFLQLGENSLNFTNPNNQVSIGSLRLVAGDLDNSATSPGTLGDDAINSVDLSVILDRFGDNDPSGNNIRANLNQDSSVNQTDLDILLNNLDLEVNL